MGSHWGMPGTITWPGSSGPCQAPPGWAREAGRAWPGGEVEDHRVALSRQIDHTTSASKAWAALL